MTVLATRPHHRTMSLKRPHQIRLIKKQSTPSVKEVCEHCAVPVPEVKHYTSQDGKLSKEVCQECGDFLVQVCNWRKLPKPIFF